MLKIKLFPRGKKHAITYRIVVAQDRSKINGKFVADLGFYTPQTKTLSLDQKEVAAWQKKGAQITQGVDKLLNPKKYPNVKKKSAETKPEVKVEIKPEVKIETVVNSPLSKGEAA